jgi:hypothetical protein
MTEHTLPHTVIFRGQSYRLGQGGVPLHLEHIAPAQLPKDWEEIDATRIFPERGYRRGYRSLTGLLVLLSVLAAYRLGDEVVELLHYCGQFWNLPGGETDAPTRAMVEEVKRQIEAAAAELGLEVRAACLSGYKRKESGPCGI